ncbi:MAG: hypothetical protein AAGA54_32080 [Myxococcota bacterium]
MPTALKTVTALLCLTFGAAACDVALYPTTSNYAGRQAARASVDLDADAPPMAEVLDVELTLDTVSLHSPIDDRWVLLSGEADAVPLLTEPRSAALREVPMQAEVYDQLTFGISRVRVATQDGWVTATPIIDEVVLDGDFPVDTDVTVRLAFDLQAGLRGSPATGFTFEPLVSVSIDDAP